MKTRGGFTLIEFIVVIIIVGILATFAVAHYGSVKKNALDKKAIANLKLLQIGQRAYHLENNRYYGSGGSNFEGLGVYLIGGEDVWIYRTHSGWGSNCQSGCVEAYKSPVSTYVGWYMTMNDTEPKIRSRDHNCLFCQ